MASILALGGAPVARASAVIVANELDGKVTVVVSGSLDLTAWDFFGSDPIFAYASPRISRVVVGAPTLPYGSAMLYVNPENFQGPASFGTGVGAVADSGSGGLFGIWGVWGVSSPHLYVSFGYVSETPFDASMTFSAASFASLGMQVGTYIWSWGVGESADSMTLQVIPEPVSMQLFAISAICLVLRRNRRLAH